MNFLLVVAGFLLSGHAFSESENLLAIEVSTEAEKVEQTNQGTLLDLSPGVSFQKGGGISSLPVIQGLADDRVNIKIDGANITSSCSNHMNPALSYADLTKVNKIDVIAGVTPVSEGGDSLAGSIIVESQRPTFSDALLQQLKLKTFFKSNNENQGASVFYSVSSDKNYVSYSGMDEKANNYRNGNNDRLKATLYSQNNQSLMIGHEVKDGVVTFKLGHAKVPYQGFVNQYMDVADNTTTLLNLNYKGSLGELFVDSTVYYQHTNHYMDILQSERSGSMPMFTRSDEMGYNLKFSKDVSANHVLKAGSDYNRYRLDDYWTSIGTTMMMGPGTFESIDNGKRDRLGIFVESDYSWNESFNTNIGLRTDIVWMDTNDVIGYNSTDNLPTDAAYFNSLSKNKRDNNYDATIISKLKVNSYFDFAFGVARKTRSPNLYERYAWAGLVTDPTTGTLDSMSAAMDMQMINWFGDGNGYVGNVNLRPEVGHKVYSSFIFHDENWETKITPFYSDIQEFIDANFLGSNMGANYLQFANHDSVIFGADFSAKAKVDSFTFKTIASYTRGYRKDGKADLYHIMPLNGKIAIEYSWKKWRNEFVTHLVDEKKQVNELRAEPETPGYALFDLGTSYQFTKLLKLDFSISNVLNQHYSLPLGGVDLVNFDRATRTPVAGMGRSYNFALNLEFF